MPLPDKYEPEHLGTPTFPLYSDGGIEVFDAPFDSVNTSAKVAVVGITPGFQQMEIAFRTVRAALVNGETEARRRQSDGGRKT